MKKTLLVLMLFLSVSCLTMPGYSEDQVSADQLSTEQKDQCLLAAKRCGNSAVSIQDKIERLKEEIAKGRAVYTQEELDNLTQKLDEVSRTLDLLLER